MGKELTKALLRDNAWAFAGNIVSIDVIDNTGYTSTRGLSALRFPKSSLKKNEATIRVNFTLSAVIDIDTANSFRREIIDPNQNSNFILIKKTKARVI